VKFSHLKGQDFYTGTGTLLELVGVEAMVNNEVGVETKIFVFVFSHKNFCLAFLENSSHQ
jgi:hypothetical protein